LGTAAVWLGLLDREENDMRRLGLVFVVAAALLAAGVVDTAKAVTPDQLTAAGWTCFRDPANPRIVCGDPAHGRPPVPPDPSGVPSYDFLVFALDGTFIGTIHLIRADLYQGQPCPPSGGPYLFIPVIGYYRCEHF
jgi:hypothetical protein